MNQIDMEPAEPLDAPDGRFAEAIVTLDGTSWVGLDANGKPIRDVDPEDAEVIDAALNWRPPEGPIR